jgi:hypothetical protein
MQLQTRLLMMRLLLLLMLLGVIRGQASSRCAIGIEEAALASVVLRRAR